MWNKLTIVLALSSLLLIAGCSNKISEQQGTQNQQASKQQPEQQPAQASAQSAPQAKKAETSKTSPAAADPPRPETASPEVQPSTGAPSAAPPASAPGSEAPAPNQKLPTTEPTSASPAQPSAKQQAKPPAQPIILTGASMGGVRFEHAKHRFNCETCHHPSLQPKPASVLQQGCTSCHTKPPQAGMKTGKQAAFHNPAATAGTCIDCHRNSSAAAPTKCTQCHKKENT
jgi:hypothetical protein